MKRKLLIGGIIIGGIVAIAPFLGMMGAMIRMFSSIGNPGSSEPRAVPSGIETVNFFQTLGLFVCPVGLGLLIFCIIKLQKLRRQPPPLPPP